MKILKNKKGSLPIILFVIGVLVLCIIAILSFSIKSRSDNLNVGVFDDIYSAVEKIQFYRNINYGDFTETEIEDLLSNPVIKVDISGNTLIISGTRGDLSVKYTVPLN